MAVMEEVNGGSGSGGGGGDKRLRDTRLSDVVLDIVMPYIHDPKDNNVVSQVCRRLTRKHVTVALCYTTTLDKLRRQFSHLQSLKLMGKPMPFLVAIPPFLWQRFNVTNYH